MIAELLFDTVKKILKKPFSSKHRKSCLLNLLIDAVIIDVVSTHINKKQPPNTHNHDTKETLHAHIGKAGESVY